MKKIKITQYLCLAFMTLMSFQAMAQCPVGETNVTVTYTSGIFDNENAWSLWDATAGVELACYATNQTGSDSQTACVTQGNDIELRAFESFGDGWDNASIEVATSDDGSNNGCDPDMNSLFFSNDDNIADGNGTYFCTSTPQNGNLVFEFNIAACGAPPGGGGGPGACSILCPPDITVTTDPYDGDLSCDAYVEIDPVEITGDCDLMTITNDFNGTTNASGVYPEGTTTVTFTVISNTGELLGCQFDVTVIDNTPPVFVECPGDMTINLDAGECSANLTFNILALDECTAPIGPLAEITNNTVYTNNYVAGVACTFNSYGMLHAYNLANIGFPQAIELFAGELQIRNSTNSPMCTFNVYEYTTDIPAGALNYGDMNLIATGSNTLPNFNPGGGGAGPGVSMPHQIDFDVPVEVNGGNIAIELVSPGWLFNGFIPGYNNAPLFENDTYFSDCGGLFPNPVPNGQVGFPTPPHVMLKLYGNNVLVGEGLPLEADPGNPFENGDAFPIGGPYCLKYTVFDEAGNSNVCEFCVTVEEFEPPSGSLACNDHVNISLDENCEAIVGADDILEGGLYGCYDNYEVNLYYDAGLTQLVPTSPLLTGGNVGQTLYVEVIDPNSAQGNSCWGTLFVEDKVIPFLECSAYEVFCNDDLTPGYEKNIPGGVSEASVQDGGNWTSTGTFENEFPISGLGTVTDVNIALDITHTWVGDLDITIESPSGTTVDVLFSQCGNTDDINVLFDDESANGFMCPIPTDGSDMQPQNALSDFDGDVAEGTWLVTVADPVFGDGGNINNITLTVEYSGIQIEVPFPVGENVTVQGSSQPYTLIGFDPCGPATLTYEDEDVDGDCVNDDYIKQIFRTWTAVDQSGNSTSCTDTITVLRSTIADLEVPTDKDGIDDDYLLCDDNFETDANGNPSPNVTGWPTILGEPVMSGGSCEFAVDYDDQIIPVCDGTVKILRNWTILAWCPTTEIVNHTQIIKVVDENGPDLTCPDDMVISTGQTDCTASAILPPPVISDACSSTTDYEVEASQGQLFFSNGVWTLYGLPLGVTVVTYSAEDGCGNENSCSFQILVEDQVPPVAICESFHVVGLTVNEPTLVPALVFDDGSYDNCELVEYKVRRMDNPNCPGNDATPFGDYVPFYCCDVGGPNVMVELRVRDAAGNTNSCMVEVEVQDKLNPAILCPPNKQLTCYEDPYDLNITGVATATDNCSAVVTHIDQGSLDNCGEGTIFRIWTATDPGGRTASCVQTISVVNDDPFYITDTNCFNQNPNDGVIWPCDYETNTCAPGLTPDITGEPTIFEDGCDLVAVTYEDLELPIQDPACLKILREWYVIDWCTYDPNTGEGYWEYTQVIKVLNSEDPVIISDCEDVAFCSYDPDCEDGEATLILEATDDCTDDAELNYYYWIDAFSDGTNDIHESGSDASGTYPIGTHTIRWDVEDGCGNVATCTYQFIIADCKAPTANLLNGIAVDIMENCMIEIAATAFDNPSSPSFDNCGIAEWRIQSPSQGPGQTTPPATADDTWTFTELEIGTNSVDIWILDINGNWGYTSTYVLVQDNIPPFCANPGAASINGTIDTEDANFIQNVEVELSGNVPGLPSPEMTGATGEYGFPGLANGANYTVTPDKDVDPLNGVTTYDLVLISKHILGIEDLGSPYKMIAADINNSGSISTIDMVELRKLILFIDTEFQNNTSWRFVDAEFVFPNANNPWETSFPEVYSINDLTGQAFADFVGVKIGDVNGTAIANDLMSGEDRNAVGDLIFNIDDVEMVAGEEYTVDFNAKDFANILGYQFTLAFDKNAVELVDVEAGELANLDANNFGMSLLEEGVITTSWNASQVTSLADDATVFSLTFTAKSNATLSNVLSVNSRWTVAEGYDSNADKLNIGLTFNNGNVVSGDFDLYQNQPNPFKAETVIGFNLPESAAATLTIYDVSGKVLKLVRGEFGQGYNEVIINRSELSGAGVLYYQLDTDTHSATKKMILID